MFWRDNRDIVKGGVFVVTLAIVSLFLAILVFIALRKFNTDEITDRSGFILIVAGIFSGLFIMMERLLKYRETEIDRDTLNANLIGSAINLLGATIPGDDGQQVPNVHARIGGIVILRRIAHSGSYDISFILDIVASYIYQISTDKENPPQNIDHKWSPRPDLTAALRLLGDPNLASRRFKSNDMQFHGISLKNCDLRNCDFSNLILDGIEFCGSDFSGSRFWNASMRYANFYQANFGAVDLGKKSSVNMVGSLLDGADLSEARGLTIEDLDKCYIDSDTLLPSSLPRVKIPPPKRIEFPAAKHLDQLSESDVIEMRDKRLVEFNRQVALLKNGHPLTGTPLPRSS